MVVEEEDVMLAEAVDSVPVPDDGELEQRLLALEEQLAEQEERLNALEERR